MKNSHNLIKVALVALAAVAAYYVFAFSVLVMPWWIAVCAAASLVSTYIGLAFLEVPEAQRPRAIRVATAAMIVEAAYGVLYVLSFQSPEWFEAPLPLALSILLAILHGGAFSVLAFSVSLLVVHGDSHMKERDALTQQLATLTAERDSALSERDAAAHDCRQWQRLATDTERQLSDMEAERRVTPRQLTADTDRVDLPPATKKARIAALAQARNVSTRTIERQIAAGKLLLEEA